jgi:glutamate dehydrogenase/leucine dehydrogenase
MVEDCLLLARAMEQKAGFHDLPFRGGKICVELAEEADLPTAFAAVGEFVAGFGGQLLAAADMGVDEQKLAWMHDAAPGLVMGRPVALGGSGHSSLATALGVFESIRAVGRFALGTGDRLGGLRVIVSGVGNVGAKVAGLLAEAGASVFVADLNAERLRPWRDRPGVTVLEGERPAPAAEVFCPCACGGVVGPDFHLPQLRAIVGAANNVLTSMEAALVLHRRGILYLPDFASNGGGLISVASESLGLGAAWAEKRARGIGERVAALLEEAQARDVPPLLVALEMADRNIARRAEEQSEKGGRS